MKYILRDALRSLLSSRRHALYYGMTFFLTTVLLFLYFNVAESARAGSLEIFADASGNASLLMYLENGNVGVIVMILIVLICAADIMFANAWFVRRKTEEIAVRMICGSSYPQLVLFLLFQTFLIVLCSVPAGIACSLLLMPAAGSVLKMTGAEFTVSVHPSASVEFITLLLFLLGWMVLLNVGTVWQSNAAEMLEETGRNKGAKRTVFTSLLTQWLPFFRWGSLFFFILPVYMFYAGSNGIVFYTFLGCMCFPLLIRTSAAPLITYLNRKKNTGNAVRAASYGFLRRDLSSAQNAVVLFLADLSILLYFMTHRGANPAEVFLLYMTFVLTAVLQAMTLMFRLETELAGRAEEYRILAETGFTKQVRKKVCSKELGMYFVITGMILLLYPGSLLVSLAANSELTGHSAVLLGILLSGILAVTYGIVRRHYLNLI